MTTSLWCRITWLSLLCFAALSVHAGRSSAAGDADAAKGLVAEHCASCHEAPGYSASGLATVEAPSFVAIANNPDLYGEERLRRSLLQPHWPMEQFRLSASDIDNVVAYLKSLRQP